MVSKLLKVGYLLLGVSLLFIGIYLYNNFRLLPQSTIVTDSTVVLEKVNKVLKLVTVEGNFSEIHKHSEHYGYDISPLRKKALIRINAKVLVGYDLEKINMEIDEKARIIYIEQFPDAEILSMDDDVEYYDITEGLFTSFSSADYTSMQKVAKKVIYDAVEESDLMDRSNEQKEDMIDLLKLSLDHIGWQLVLKDQKTTILD